MENNFCRWENDFTCIILKLEEFVVLPNYEEVHKINVIRPVMYHDYKVLEALIDILSAVVHKKSQTSKLYPIEKFNFSA